MTTDGDAIRRMIEGRGGPTGRFVAGVALLGRRYVISRFRLGVYAHIGSAVAGGALAGCARVVHGRRLEAGEIGVAAIARTRRRNMRGRLACCVEVVVAGCTTSRGYAAVVERCVPGIGTVTSVAGCVGGSVWNVIGAFPSCC